MSVVNTGHADAILAQPAGRVPMRLGQRRRSWAQIAGALLVNLPRPAWIAIDAFLLWVAMVQGFRWIDLNAMPLHASPWVTYAVFSLSMCVASLVFGLNEQSTLASRWRILTRMTLTAGVSTLIVYAVVYVLMYAALSRRVTLVTVGGYFVSAAALRFFANYVVEQVRRRLLVVGTHVASASFVDRLDARLRQSHEVVGFVNHPNARGPSRLPGLPRLGTTQDIVHLARELQVDDIVVCNGLRRDKDVMSWMLPCLRLGCRVTNEATFYETAMGEILVDEITPDWFLFSDLKAHSDEYATVKRVFDVAVSIVGLAVSVPFYPLVALAIKLEDGGPVFYTQTRVGRGGALFKLFKFRTMRVSAGNQESVWAARNDPRRTRVGRLLRSTRFDEFPQFYNILVGQMSVVGPRPEQPSIHMQLCQQIPYWSERNLIKPGLTGWAQISYHYGASLSDAKRKLQFDFFYLKHMGLELDTIILFRTLGTFLRGAC